MQAQVEELIVKLTGEGSSYLGMMAKAGQANAELVEGTQKSSRQIDGVRFSLNEAGQAMQNLLATMGASLTGLGIGVMAVRLAAQAETMKISFGVMLKSTEKGKQMFEDLANFAAKTPFELTGLASAAKTLLQFNIEGEAILPMLERLGNVAGGDSQRLESLALAFGQMSSTGRLMGQDLNQMINAGFNPLLEMAEHASKQLGGTVQSHMARLRVEMEHGMISVQDVENAFARASAEGGRFYQNMEKASKSLSGLFSNLKDDVSATLRDLGDSIEDTFQLKEVIKGLSTASKAVKDFFNDLPDSVKDAITWIGRITGGIVAFAGAGFVLQMVFSPIINMIRGSFAASLSVAKGGLDYLTGGLLTTKSAADQTVASLSALAGASAGATAAGPGGWSDAARQAAARGTPTPVSPVTAGTGGMGAMGALTHPVKGGGMNMELLSPPTSAFNAANMGSLMNSGSVGVNTAALKANAAAAQAATSAWNMMGAAMGVAGGVFFSTGNMMAGLAAGAMTAMPSLVNAAAAAFAAASVGADTFGGKMKALGAGIGGFIKNMMQSPTVIMAVVYAVTEGVTSLYNWVSGADEVAKAAEAQKSALDELARVRGIGRQERLSTITSIESPEERVTALQSELAKVQAETAAARAASVQATAARAAHWTGPFREATTARLTGAAAEAQRRLEELTKHGNDIRMAVQKAEEAAGKAAVAKEGAMKIKFRVELDTAGMGAADKQMHELADLGSRSMLNPAIEQARVQARAAGRELSEAELAAIRKRITDEFKANSTMFKGLLAQSASVAHVSETTALTADLDKRRAALAEETQTLQLLPHQVEAYRMAWRETMEDVLNAARQRGAIEEELNAIRARGLNAEQQALVHTRAGSGRFGNLTASILVVDQEKLNKQVRETTWSMEDQATTLRWHAANVDANTGAVRAFEMRLAALRQGIALTTEQALQLSMVGFQQDTAKATMELSEFVKGMELQSASLAETSRHLGMTTEQTRLHEMQLKATREGLLGMTEAQREQRRVMMATAASTAEYVAAQQVAKSALEQFEMPAEKYLRTAQRIADAWASGMFGDDERVFQKAMQDARKLFDDGSAAAGGFQQALKGSAEAMSRFYEYNLRSRISPLMPLGRDIVGRVLEPPAQPVTGSVSPSAPNLEAQEARIRLEQESMAARNQQQLALSDAERVQAQADRSVERAQSRLVSARDTQAGLRGSIAERTAELARLEIENRRLQQVSFNATRPREVQDATRNLRENAEQISDAQQALALLRFQTTEAAAYTAQREAAVRAVQAEAEAARRATEAAWSNPGGRARELDSLREMIALVEAGVEIHFLPDMDVVNARIALLERELGASVSIHFIPDLDDVLQEVNGLESNRPLSWTPSATGGGGSSSTQSTSLLTDILGVLRDVSGWTQRTAERELEIEAETADL